MDTNGVQWMHFISHTHKWRGRREPARRLGFGHFNGRWNSFVLKWKFHLHAEYLHTRTHTDRQIERHSPTFMVAGMYFCSKTSIYLHAYTCVLLKIFQSQYVMGMRKYVSSWCPFKLYFFPARRYACVCVVCLMIFLHCCKYSYWILWDVCSLKIPQETGLFGEKTPYSDRQQHGVVVVLRLCFYFIN